MIVLFPHEKRTIVALEGCGITSAGKPGEIADVCPLIAELDVTNNQINYWNEVYNILWLFVFCDKLNMLHALTKLWDKVAFGWVYYYHNFSILYIS